MRSGLAAAILAGALAAAGGARAQVIAVDNICETAGIQVNTVNVRLMSPGLFDYMFTRTSDGHVTTFAATTAGWNRKFALAPGTYKLTFKHPNTTPVGSWANPIYVKEYKLVNGQCMFINPLDKARKFNRGAGGF